MSPEAVRCESLTQGRDGGGGGSSDTRERLQRSRTGWKGSAMALDNIPGTLVQVPSPAVITQSTPQAHDLVLRRRSQRGDRGQPLQEPREIGKDRGHLGLLEHDLRQPDPIGIAGVLPRKVVAAAMCLPCDHAAGKFLLVEDQRVQEPAAAVATPSLRRTSRTRMR